MQPFRTIYIYKQFDKTFKSPSCDMVSLKNISQGIVRYLNDESGNGDGNAHYRIN